MNTDVLATSMAKEKIDFAKEQAADARKDREMELETPNPLTP